MGGLAAKERASIDGARTVTDRWDYEGLVSLAIVHGNERDMDSLII